MKLPLHMVLCLLISVLASCVLSGNPGPVSEYVLGTICTVNLYEKGSPALYAKAFERLQELEDILSANRQDTDLDRVNQNAGIGPVPVRPELIEVLEKALVFAELSRGYFDPSVGPLVKLWGIGTAHARVPAEDEIREAMSLINHRGIEINRAEGTVFLKRKGMALDLGAIAKGYAADELARLLAGKDVGRAIIDLGGDISALGERKTAGTSGGFLSGFLSGGKKPDDDESFWRIGIQDPRENRGLYIGILKVKNKNVVTSGTYERFFVEDEKHYHHIFSIESGYPVANGLMSVTVLAGSCIDADALSTAAFALGWERGMELIAAVPGAEGIFVFEDLGVRITEGAEKAFTLTAAEYHLVR